MTGSTYPEIANLAVAVIKTAIETVIDHCFTGQDQIGGLGITKPLMQLGATYVTESHCNPSIHR